MEAKSKPTKLVRFLKGALVFVSGAILSALVIWFITAEKQADLDEAIDAYTDYQAIYLAITVSRANALREGQIEHMQISYDGEIESTLMELYDRKRVTDQYYYWYVKNYYVKNGIEIPETIMSILQDINVEIEPADPMMKGMCE